MRLRWTVLLAFALMLALAWAGRVLINLGTSSATVRPQANPAGSFAGDCSDAALPARRDPGNPLGTPGHTAGSPDPLDATRFFVDPWGYAVPYVQRYEAAGQAAMASALSKIASQPEAERFGWFTGEGPYVGARRLLCRAEVQEPGTVPLISIYRLRHQHCGNYDGDPPSEEQAYNTWIDDFARGVGRFPAVIFYEEDALLTTGCLNHHGLVTRIHELRHGIDVLSRLPHAVIYVDAGAQDGLTVERAAWLLKHVGARKIQGFFLNSTHYNWTASEISYGRKISRALGGVHFIVSTAVNGNGPLISRKAGHSAYEVLCNPPGRALGTPPTAATGNPLVDGLLWIGNPGMSGGRCNGSQMANGEFDPGYAAMLASNAHW